MSSPEFPEIYCNRLIPKPLRNGASWRSAPSSKLEAKAQEEGLSERRRSELLLLAKNQLFREKRINDAKYSKWGRTPHKMKMEVRGFENHNSKILSHSEARHDDREWIEQVWTSQ